MCNTAALPPKKGENGRLIYFLDIWTKPKCQKNKSSVQKNLFAAEGGCLATKKIYRSIVFKENIENTKGV